MSAARNREPHAGRAIAHDLDAFDGRVHSNLDTALIEQTDQRTHNRRGASHREVNPPFPLQPMDQEIDGRSSERVSADQQRLKREDLPQRLIADVVRDQTVEAPIGAKPNQVGNDTNHRAEGREVGIDQLRVANVEDSSRVVDQFLVAVDISGVELCNLREEAIIVPDIVEVPPVREQHPIERIDGNELEVVATLLPEQLEELIKEIGGGDNGRTCIEAEALGLERTGSSSRLVTGLQQRHPMAERTKPASGSEASEAGADHDGVFTHDLLLSVPQAE